MEMATDHDDQWPRAGIDESKDEQGPRQMVLAMWNQVLISK